MQWDLAGNPTWLALSFIPLLAAISLGMISCFSRRRGITPSLLKQSAPALVFVAVPMVYLHFAKLYV